jgi:hypothetical protein
VLDAFFGGTGAMARHARSWFDRLTTNGRDGAAVPELACEALRLEETARPEPVEGRAALPTPMKAHGPK